MKRSRRLALAVALATVIGIPGSAVASGSPNCVGQTAQMVKWAFRGVAQSGQGAVGDWLGAIRTEPESFAWCS